MENPQGSARSFTPPNVTEPMPDPAPLRREVFRRVKKSQNMFVDFKRQSPFRAVLAFRGVHEKVLEKFLRKGAERAEGQDAHDRLGGEGEEKLVRFDFSGYQEAEKLLKAWLGSYRIMEPVWLRKLFVEKTMEELKRIGK